MAQTFSYSDDATDTRKLRAEDQDDSGDETTPTTTVSECTDVISDDDIESITRDVEKEEAGSPGSAAVNQAVSPQLGPGLFHDDDDTAIGEDSTSPRAAEDSPALTPIAAPSLDDERPDELACTEEPGVAPIEGACFTMQETLFVFDWDDTILPSSWIQRQGLRVDSSSILRQLQIDKLAELAKAAAQTLHLAKQHGTVVLLTNAERGWIELSCQKFLPSLLPMIENVKIVSARTAHETSTCTSPLDWKVLAFEAEIARACGVETLVDSSKRKNIFSLGDSVHEREALLRATEALPSCCSKSLKFMERPDISHLLKQHTLVSNCFQQVVHHDGNLDLCINC